MKKIYLNGLSWQMFGLGYQTWEYEVVRNNE